MKIIKKTKQIFYHYLVKCEKCGTIYGTGTPKLIKCNSKKCKRY